MKKLTSRLSAGVLGWLPVALQAMGQRRGQRKQRRAKKPLRRLTSAKRPDKPVDINSATEKELITLPGIGAKTAKEIVSARPFKTVDDLKNVKGIGDKTFEKLKGHVVCNPAKK